MLICCWSAKGGSGVTVVAAALALAAARSVPSTVVDLCGDLPTALGLAEPTRAGVAEWSRGSSDTSFDEYAVPVMPQLRLVPRGDGDLRPLHPAAIIRAAHGDGAVVVDAGVLHAADAPAAPLVTGADRSLLVLRPCFLALRRAVKLGVRPQGVVLVAEPQRALAAADVSAALGVPVVAEVPVHASVSRAVDAGLLAARCPQALARPLEHLR